MQTTKESYSDYQYQTKYLKSINKNACRGKKGQFALIKKNAFQGKEGYFNLLGSYNNCKHTSHQNVSSKNRNEGRNSSKIIVLDFNIPL